MDLKKYHLAEGPEIISQELPGERGKVLLDEQENYESNNRAYPRSIPLVPHKAKGSIVEDVDGNRFLDFFSFCGVLNVGHGNQDVVQEVEKQLHQLTHALDFPTEVKIDFMKNMNSHLPEAMQGNFKINFCGPTGADAVEAAMKLARLNTKRNLVIAFQGAFHGMTQGALSVTSNTKNRQGLPVLNNATHFVPFCYPYRLPEGTSSVVYAKHIRDIIENPKSGVDKPAAILLESVQAEAGNIVPTREFVQEIRKICDDHGIMMICDEVQAGFYRTGKLFAFEHFDVIPDMVTMSKGVGGIGLPLSLLLVNKEYDVWDAGTHSGTFRGHQPGIAAGNAALNFIRKSNLTEHIFNMGVLLRSGLERIQQGSKFIGDVRGLGLLIGVEYVKSKDDKIPFPEICTKLKNQLFRNGVLVEIGGHYNNVIRILPPLVTTEAMIHTFLEIYERLNNEVSQSYFEEEPEMAMEA